MVKLIESKQNDLPIASKSIFETGSNKPPMTGNGLIYPLVNVYKKGTGKIHHAMTGKSPEISMAMTSIAM